MYRYGTFTTLAFCAALSLSGCAESTRDLYEGEQTESDVLPEDIAVDRENWETSTSRLLAAHDGHEFYAFVSTTDGDCLLTYEPQAPENWVVGCGTAGPLGTMGPTGVKTKFDPEGLSDETSAGWTRLTPELEVTGT